MRRLLTSALVGLALGGTAAGQEALSPAAEGALDALTRPLEFSAQRASSANPDLAKNGDARTIAPGETLVLGELAGPGTITHLWCTVGTYDPFYARMLVLRIYWDGAVEPSVEAPLGDFFGVGHAGEADFASAVVTNSSLGRSRNCFWRMPFAKGAKVTVTNETTRGAPCTFYYYLDWRQEPNVGDEICYFHAQYRQATPAAPGDYTLVETEGRGHYVGTVLSVHQTKTGWFGEGDDRFYIDGAAEPQLRGTGTEDYFGDAWGFRPFATPYLGVTLYDGIFPGDRVTAYRWHVTDPVTFRSALRVAIEHRGSVFSDLGIEQGSFLERPDWYSSVAFWYQRPARGVGGTLPAAQRRIAPYQVVDLAGAKLTAAPKMILTRQRDGIMYLPGKDDARLEMEFEVAEKGRYQVRAQLVRSVFGGVYQATLDERALGEPVDMCGLGMDPFWQEFDLHDLEPGVHRLRFEGRGRSPRMRTKAPAMFGMGLKHLVLLRLQDLEGFEAKLKK